MRAVVYDKPLEFSIREVPEPVPGAGEILLRTRVTGVCGTDLHLHAGDFFPRYPLTPGHEIVGAVEALGPGVERPRQGELVAVDNLLSCGRCAACRNRQPHYCENLRAFGVTDPGGFAEYAVVPAHKCYPIGSLSLDAAVLAEPSACAVHGMDVLELREGADVLLFGAGPTGLLLAQLLRQGGAGRVTVAAPTAAKLELALGFGVDRVQKVEREDLTAAVGELRRAAPAGFDTVVEATGAPSVLAAGLELVRDGGTVLVYGMAGEQERLPVSPYEIFRRELTIKGSFAQAYSYDRAIALLQSGRISTEDIVTHRFGLDDYGEALEATRSDKSCLKAVVEP